MVSCHLALLRVFVGQAETLRGPFGSHWMCMLGFLCPVKVMSEDFKSNGIHLQITTIIKY
jgi:hypothetical protein